MLAVLDLGQGCAIGVRVAENLLRPAHFFRLLRQDDLKNCKSLLNYHIERQIRSGWMKPKSGKVLETFLERTIEEFAKLSALMEEEYIFNWLDWDGDNVLADGSLLDYGSIRQFGLKHDRYRYDDIERFSTCLVEQKNKAAKICQVFAQLVDWVKSGQKKPLESFKDSQKIFDEYYRDYKLVFQRRRIGVNHKKADPIADDLLKEIRFLENCKSTAGVKNVADGINHSAIANVRCLLNRIGTKIGQGGLCSNDELIQALVSEHCNRKDRDYLARNLLRLRRVQKLMKTLIEESPNPKKTLAQIVELNREDRITGDSCTFIVDMLIRKYKKSKSDEEVGQRILSIIHSQIEWKTTVQVDPFHAEVKKIFLLYCQSL